MKKLLSIIIFIFLVFTVEISNQFVAYGKTDYPNPIKLTIQETLGIERIKEPITSGVPLPKDTVFDVNQLRVLDGNKQEVPAQFKVLSRWGQLSDTTKAIKWALVDFQADVPANSTAVYYLEYAAEFTKDYGPNLLTDNGDLISFNTGRLNFSINKDSFSLFDNVSVDGKKIVDTSEQNGIFVIEYDTGKIYNSILGAPLEIDVEENGPLKAVLQVQGPLMVLDGEYLGKEATENTRLSQPYPYVHYNIRITVYKDKGYAKVLFIFENDGASGVWPESKYTTHQNIYIEDLRLKTFLNFKDPAIYTVNSQYFGDKVVLAARGQFADIIDTFPYTFNIDGSVVETGIKYPGWIEVSEGGKNIALGMKYFWQKHPVDLSYDNGSLEIAVMPQGEGYPLGVNDYYVFDGGRHYGVELLYRFSTGIRDAKETEKSMVFLQDPLFAFAEPNYYAAIGAWVKLAPPYVQVSDLTQQEAINRYEKQVLAQADIAYAEPTEGGRKPANTVSTYRGDSSKWFGSLNFGDILWAKNYSSLSWDWTQGMLLHMLRHSDAAFWKQAQEFIPHKRDVDQYWGDRTDSLGAHVYINHLSRYEADGHARPGMDAGYGYNPSPAPSHNWNGGLVLSYLLTGDEESLEAAEESYLFAYGKYKDRIGNPIFGIANCELRWESWPMVTLLNLYRVRGEQKYLDLALALGKDLLLGEQHSGGNGLWEGPDNVAPTGSCGNTKMQNVMFAFVADGLTDLYEETGDKDIGDLLVRMADYSMETIIYGGEYNDAGLYKPLQLDYNYTGEENRTNDSTTVWNYYFTDLMAVVYKITGNAKYLNFARQLFKDVSFYYYGGNNYEYIDPARRDPAVYADNMFNATWIKVKGWLLRSHQIYLNVENQASFVYAKGDINADGKVDILDLQLCVNVLLGVEARGEMVDNAKRAAEPVDECDVLDVQAVVNLIFGG
ncbi:MAG: hypothetical protein ABIH18_07185 [Candidatus Omnitrophota bacterium]